MMPFAKSQLSAGTVLPTSGSRGCTAAVVELVFNSDLTKEATKSDGEGQDGRVGEEVAVATSKPSSVPVYRGEVEFITLEDWRKE